MTIPRLNPNWFKKLQARPEIAPAAAPLPIPVKETEIDFDKAQYIQDVYPKRQIVVHHTVSPPGVTGDISWFITTPERVATPDIIAHDGEIFNLFDHKFWASHLYVHSPGNSIKNHPHLKRYYSRQQNIYLDKGSIAIELDSWGGLIKSGNAWYPGGKWENGKLQPNLKYPIRNVQEYPEGFRGFYGFQKYTDEQIKALEYRLKELSARFNIPLMYHPQLFEVNEHALRGDAGVWTHVSYRSDKSDCHPQPELIQMLKTFNS